MKKFLLSLAFVSAITAGYSQVKTPAPSPSSTLKQTVGLTDVTVDYSRPSIKGRKIFGKLVPYNKVWRTGANGSTDIEFSTDVKFGGKDVKAGKYALYTIPGKNEWTVMLYADTEIWGDPGDKFDQSKVVAQTVVKPNSNNNVETFEISFNDLQDGGANLTLEWAKTQVKIPIVVDYATTVEKSIEKTMAGPSAGDYNKAAAYYLKEGKNLQQALEMAKKAESLRPDAFWMIKTQSEIYAKLGDYKNAIKAAKKSLKLAEKANYLPYIKMNEANIASWKKK